MGGGFISKQKCRRLVLQFQLTGEVEITVGWLYVIKFKVKMSQSQVNLLCLIYIEDKHQSK